jgi:hypothetical protein
MAAKLGVARLDQIQVHNQARRLRLGPLQELQYLLAHSLRLSPLRTEPAPLEARAGSHCF